MSDLLKALTELEEVTKEIDNKTQSVIDGLKIEIEYLKKQLIHSDVVITALAINSIRKINSETDNEIEDIRIPYQFLIEIGQTTILEMKTEEDTLFLKPVFLKNAKEPSSEI
jgi:predicted nuclease of restriction endonuclease-like (RecB) superfamily